MRTRTDVCFFVFLNKHDPCGFSQGEAYKKKKKRRSLSEKEREGLSTTTIPSPEQKQTRGVITEEGGGWRGVAVALGEAEVPFT